MSGEIEINTTAYSAGAGGIAYRIYNGKVIACVNKVKIAFTGETGRNGGIASLLDGTGSGAIIACENYGNITANGDASYAAGIVGYVQKAKSVLACINHGDISASGIAGGIIGYIFNVPAYSCVSEGAMTGDLMAGGVVGNASYNTFPAFPAHYFYSTVSDLKLGGLEVG
ncbi:MAG: hypothetical protein LUE99_18140 [Bacteroides sp.]|nr:hypothetical protein [Bacteroides sp.]